MKSNFAKNVGILILVALSCLEGHQVAAGINWSCEANVTDYPFDAERISGIWYETARLPPSDVPACVKVIAPASTTDASLSYPLQVDYVNNVNNGWQPTTENLTFPWNNATKNGQFRLTYGGGSSIEVNVDFKLVYTDYDTMTVVCGTTGLSSISLMKILTRERQLNATLINTVETVANLYGLESDITWVDQSERCNDAGQMIPWPGLLLLIACSLSLFYAP